MAVKWSDLLKLVKPTSNQNKNQSGLTNRRETNKSEPNPPTHGQIGATEVQIVPIEIVGRVVHYQINPTEAATQIRTFLTTGAPDPAL